MILLGCMFPFINLINEVILTQEQAWADISMLEMFLLA